MERYMKLLGMRVKDAVTGFTGVVTSVSFDLYGCVQVIVNPGLDKEGKARDSLWFDFARLKVTAPDPVMPPPDFVNVPRETATARGEKGPADRPREMKA